MEEIAKFVTRYLSIIIEILAAIIIGIALMRFLYRYTLHLVKQKPMGNVQAIRIEFGGSLTLVLELLLGADILATAIAPTWDEIGKLAAIIVLRTGLNYFLERELKSFRMSEKETK